MKNTISHDFPLSYIHEGTTLGNGVLGLSVWGGGRTLNLSLGSSLLWDHRGGMSWNEKQNFPAIRNALKAGNKKEMDAIFAVDAPPRPDDPPRPSLIPLGRIEITLPGDAKLLRSELDLNQGIVSVFYGKEEKQIRFVLSQQQKGAFAFQSDEPLKIRVRPACELSDALKSIGFSAPETFENGFEQSMPEDSSFRVEGKAFGKVEWRFSFSRKTKPEFVRFHDLLLENQKYWKEFWEEVPAVSCPEPAVEELYRLGLFKFQSMTAPDGYPAGLQGPWIEDDSFPAWSGDYHFNINVEMCYWPAYHSGLWNNLMPMFRMVLGWREKLRFNAKCFVGIDDGYMMPHAVDDRCVCMGAFWTGCIDHACAAWIAQMMFDYVRFTGDLEFLKQDAFDFMRGVMRVYESMLERVDGKLVLPVGVSPEYRGAEMDAWGENASFQLAAIHRLANDLVEAAGLLGKTPDSAWLDIQKNLPEATVGEVEPGKPEIFLWRGTPLGESHRHHSHLASLCPFNTVQADDPAWRDVLENSRKRWVGMGMGRWAGWSMPWAVMLHNRFHEPEMAVTLIDFWKRCYTNPGGGTLHDPLFGGVSLGLCGNSRVMQMDAAMGMVAAIADLFVYETGGVVYPLHGVPSSWKMFTVERIRCSNGLIFSAERKGESLSFVFRSSGAPVRLRFFFNGRITETDLAPERPFFYEAVVMRDGSMVENKNA